MKFEVENLIEYSGITVFIYDITGDEINTYYWVYVLSSIATDQMWEVEETDEECSLITDIFRDE